MDTYAGNSQDPVTLNKYVYGNSDGVNWSDPSGHFGLASFSTSFSMQGILAASAITAVGLSSVDFSTSSNSTDSIVNTTYGILWNVIAVSHFNSELATGATSASGAKTKRRERSPNDGHHTIPIYLCGARAQKLSSIDRKQHGALHAGLALIAVAKDSAEAAADKMIPFTRRRSGAVLDLAGSKVGRRVISGAIQGFYQYAGWWSQGTPTIGSVFPEERTKYISGHTSLPECTRARPQ